MKRIFSVLILFLLSGFFANSRDGAGTGRISGGVQTPFTALVVVQDVADFDTWERVISANAALLNSAGLTLPAFARCMDDSKRILAFYTVTDAAKARALVNSSEWPRFLHFAGVTGTPAISWLNVDYDLNYIMQQQRIFVTQRVKNYKNWRSVFEGKEHQSRTASGLVDRLIARDESDVHLVTVYFGVKDMDKARAYIASPGYQKFCKDAGLDGEPEISWYRWINYWGNYYDDSPVEK